MNKVDILKQKYKGRIKPYGEPTEYPGIAFCFGDGWLDLVDNLMEDLFDLGWDGDVRQTKEKLGGLRFYIGAGTEEIFDKIDKAEEESLTICETCGAPGKPREGGWIKTLCDRCANPSQ
jgi:hypothetical protein